MLCVSGAWAAEKTELEETPFQDRLKALQEERDESAKLRRAHDLARVHHLSSLQVKAIAERLKDDSARLEFAVAAYPRTIDPENFYEVYDAFTAFSKVMRLHDRIHQFEPARTPPVVAAPATVSAQEFKDILRALKAESFDQTRSQIARQILGNSRKLFLVSQIKQMLDCFDFEPSKLEIAKYAYERTADRDKYFLVNESFSFDNSKQELSRYIQSRSGK